MQHKFCLLTKEPCREDCALYVKYEIEDCNQEYYTGCAFAVNARATVANANSADYVVDSLEQIDDKLYGIASNMP